MTKIDVISGFLGAGKTTLIKKLLSEGIKDKVVLIENEFGEIGVDGSFLKDSGVDIKEINSGCICCSLVGDFEKSLTEVIETYKPDRVIIEPSGVGKLTDIIEAINKCEIDLMINSLTTVVDGTKCRMYIKNFGEFFNNQISAATTVILSRVDKLNDDKIEKCVDMIREINPVARIITTPLTDLSGEAILNVMEANFLDLENELAMELQHHDHEHHHHDHEEGCCCGHDHDHEHHHHDHEEGCCCGHDHDHEHHHHEEGCCCGHDHEHEHHHHDHEEGCCCGHDHDHEHHHHEEGECCCGHHDHDHEHHHDGECSCGHHHHHADEVFTSIGIETVKTYSYEELENILKELTISDELGIILRAKGILKGENTWLYFDLTPEEYEIREGKPDFTGRLCVIGSNLNEEAIKNLF